MVKKVNRKELDNKILKVASLGQMLININKVLETTKNPEQIDKYNQEFRIRYIELKEAAADLSKGLDVFFKYEKENNSPIDFKIRSIKKQIAEFLS